MGLKSFGRKSSERVGMFLLMRHLINAHLSSASWSKVYQNLVDVPDMFICSFIAYDVRMRRIYEIDIVYIPVRSMN